MRASLSVMFDISVEVNEVIYYSGFPPYLLGVKDSLADFFSLSRKHLWYAEDAKEHPNEGRRFRRSIGGVIPHDYSSSGWPKSEDFTYSLSTLLDDMSIRTEFDILQASHYNASVDYYHTLLAAASNSRLWYINIKAPKRLNLELPFSVTRIITTLSPFDMAFPRLLLLREILDGYLPNQHILGLAAAGKRLSLSLRHADLHTILGLAWNYMYPDDVEGSLSLTSGEVDGEDFEDVVSQIYTGKYARIPVLFVFLRPADAVAMSSLFLYPIRNTKSAPSWTTFSPFMSTTSTSFIPWASYSVCISPSIMERSISKTANRTGLYAIRGKRNRKYMEFKAACVSSTLHLTFEEHVSDILDNALLPHRIKSIMSSGSTDSAWLAALEHDQYDPGLTEILSRVTVDTHEKVNPHALGEKTDTSRTISHTLGAIPKRSKRSIEERGNIAYAEFVGMCRQNCSRLTSAFTTISVLDRLDDEVIFSGKIETDLIPRLKLCNHTDTGYGTLRTGGFWRGGLVVSLLFFFTVLSFSGWMTFIRYRGRKRLRSVSC